MRPSKISPCFSSASSEYVYVHMHKILSHYNSRSLFQVQFVKQFAVAQVCILQLQPISLDSPRSRELGSCSSLPPPSPPPPTCPCLSHRACFQSNFPRLVIHLGMTSMSQPLTLPLVTSALLGDAPGKPTHLQMCLLFTHGYQPDREA